MLPEGPPNSVVFYDTQGDTMDLFYTGPSQVLKVVKIDMNYNKIDRCIDPKTDAMTVRCHDPHITGMMCRLRKIPTLSIL
jgi:hypothetical protein